MNCFCNLSHSGQMILIILLWMECLAGTVLPVYRVSHRRIMWHTIFDITLLLMLLRLLCWLVRYNHGAVINNHFYVPGLWCVIILVFLYEGIGFMYEYKGNRKKINEWSIKEAIDDLPVGLCFADPQGRIVLCNHKMNVLSHMVIGRDLQTISSLTDAFADMDGKNGFAVLKDVSDCYRFPDDRVYRICCNKLDTMQLQGYMQLSAHDETEIYENTMRLRENNAELERVNEKLQKMYERMADDVRERESLDLKVYLHDTLGRSLLTVQDVRNSLSSEVKQKLKNLKEAVSMLAAGRMDISGSFEEAQIEASQLGVKVILQGYIPSRTEEERLITAAVRECVTNCVRHAKGNEVYVKVTERNQILRTEITNNGQRPKNQITEGSGLSSLRRSVETFGGEMHISHRPGFSLVLHFPRKENMF